MLKEFTLEGFVPLPSQFHQGRIFGLAAEGFQEGIARKVRIAIAIVFNALAEQT